MYGEVNNERNGLAANNQNVTKRIPMVDFRVVMYRLVMVVIQKRKAWRESKEGRAGDGCP